MASPSVSQAKGLSLQLAARMNDISKVTPAGKALSSHTAPFLPIFTAFDSSFLAQATWLNCSLALRPFLGFGSEDLLAHREASSSPTHTSIFFQIREKVEMPALHLG